jgi:predicted site-specific integrase-resolvase
MRDIKALWFANNICETSWAMATLGYARVSTQDQDLSGQIEALKAAGATTIYREKVSGVRYIRRKGRTTIIVDLFCHQTSRRFVPWELTNLEVIEASDKIAKHLRRSCRHRVNSTVAVVTLDRIFRAVSVAAKDLHCLVGNLNVGLGRE